MRALIIDSENKTLRSVYCNDSLESIYENLSTEKVTCTCFDVVHLDKDKGDIYVDDEGLFKPYDHGFIIEDVKTEKVICQIKGNGFILGLNKLTGESTDTSFEFIDFVGLHKYRLFFVDFSNIENEN